MGKGGGSVRDIDKGYKRTARALEVLAEKRYVVIGIRGEAGARRERAVTVAKPTKSGRPSKKTTRAGIADGNALTLVEIAAVNEFGSEDGRIPERSYMRSAFDENLAKYRRVLIKAVDRVILHDGDMGQELELIGLRVTTDIKRKIGTLREPPNAALTIAKKGSSKPLIDTGRLRASVDHEVRKDE